jgi:NhaA family Na+:H+ antiporter
VATAKISISIVLARVIGKVVGISLFAYLFTRYTKLRLPKGLDLKEIVGVGFLAGMGLTVSIVIAEITLKTDSELAQARMGLFFAALVSGALGLLWLRRFPVSLQ